MSFASILSSSTHEPPSITSPLAAVAKPQIMTETSPSIPQAVNHLVEEKSAPPIPAGPVTNGDTTFLQHGAVSKNAAVPPVRIRKNLTQSEHKRISEAMTLIDETQYSDLENSGFKEESDRYKKQTLKRMRQNDEDDTRKKKRRRTYLLDQFLKSFNDQATNAAERFRAIYEPEAQDEVTQKDINDEKERKKDMQRKRRREQQLRNEAQKAEELAEKARNAENAEDAEMYRQQYKKALGRITQTKNLLDGVATAEEIAEAGPVAPDYEGGITSTLPVGSPEPGEPPKKRAKQNGGPSARLKKSKQKKQAEKDAAEAAQAAMERDPLVSIAPKQDRRESVKKDPKSSTRKDHSSTMHIVNFDSKGYNQIYEQIWRDLSRKDVPKVARIKTISLQTRQENMRKTAILASKQARKWQERTNKSMKDTQARAKRVMREMMSFWKRNEREERETRKQAERKELDDARKAEADREANRQRRKLNFLISQTELYSHFIGRKIKTDEVERATDDPGVAASTEKIQSGNDSAHTTNLPDPADNFTGKTKVTNFEDLDFDAEDETTLREAAMANAQNAIQEAQDKARNFNGEDQMNEFDHGDMNFQNPTMLSDIQVSQPKMLEAQLKEYQLKGLNWLVNLYEQGINGILADEMGLGKTVQSISVLGYLAEQHNVWGPFLVIAPSSTLHNWQQEITRFAPSIKVLPYWGNAKDRKVLRKFWDRKHVTYNRDSEFHVLVTSYQLVVQDAQYFQKIRWQYMVLDEAQAIKSSNSSRWKVLLGFHCRNRLLLTGTPIQNNMQELWALLHFIMPSLFDSHDEFSDWFSKDIESHAQSNTKLNQDQLKRLHMILKPFMLRRVKAHVQKELGDKDEIDVFCDLTYRQRAYYSNLRSKISIMDLIEKATLGQDEDTATLMNLVMQFRKVCNHPDLFERADTTSPYSMSHYAETISFLREGSFVQLGYSVRNSIEYHLPRILCNDSGCLDVAGPCNASAGFRSKYLRRLMNVWSPDFIQESIDADGTFGFLRFADVSPGEAASCAQASIFDRALRQRMKSRKVTRVWEDGPTVAELPTHSMLNIVPDTPRNVLAGLDPNSRLSRLANISQAVLEEQGYPILEPAAKPGATAPPIQISCSDQSSIVERNLTLFNVPVRNAIYPADVVVEEHLLENDVTPSSFPPYNLLPAPASQHAKYTNISVPSMRRFVTDSGKLARLDALLRQLKNGGHRVLLYFQMTRMIDLMEEYLTYRNYKYCRLDGSTKLEDRRDTVHDFQTRPEIFIFLLSTRAGGLGINLTAADTVIFYDSDWNPTIDSQAMDRAHRLGQTKQVTVYRMITRGTIEERIRKRAMQKEEVQRVVITGGSSQGVDFNTRDRRENRTKDIALWLADDDQAALIEQREKEAAERGELAAADQEPKKKSKKAMAAAAAGRKRRGEMSLDDMYHEGKVFSPPPPPFQGATNRSTRRRPFRRRFGQAVWNRYSSSGRCRRYQPATTRRPRLSRWARN